MAQERISMRKITEVLKLHFEAKISRTKISDIARISRYTVSNILGLLPSVALEYLVSRFD